MKVNVSKEITSKQQNYILLISLLGLIHLILDINPFAPEPPVTARADPDPFYPL